jgi:hypothetical protein
MASKSKEIMEIHACEERDLRDDDKNRKEKSPNEELQNVYTLPNFNKVIKSKKMCKVQLVPRNFSRAER